MPDSPFIAAGAAVPPVAAAPLNTNRLFTGIWTNRSPLRDAATPYLYEKFYSASRYDSIIRGSNCEITTRLSLIRRAGNSVYNSTLFPPISRFFEFRSIINNNEQIQILADVDPAAPGGQGSVRDVTGPSTNRTLFTKDPAAGRTAFLAVSNSVYFGDGVDLKKMLNSGIAWKPNTAFKTGQFIVDPFGNIQESVGAQTATIINISIDSNVVSLFFSPTTPLTVVPNVRIVLNGLTTVPALNGINETITSVGSAVQVQFSRTLPNQAYTTETGTVSTGTGISGGSAPAWATTVGTVTLDGTLQWVNRGSQVQDWGIDAPDSAPTVTQAAAPTIYQPAARSTWYAPLFVVEDSNNNLQQLVVSGKTGASAPVWPTTPVGTITVDGTASWKLLGAAAWQATHTYAAGDVIQATFTYYITSTQTVFDHTTKQWVTSQVTTPVTVTCIFQCSIGGVSGPVVPAWVNGTNTSTTDGGATWSNMGTAVSYASLGATQDVSTLSITLDPNGYQQTATALGKTGATAPAAWAPTLGAYTVDGGETWQNTGPFGAANTGAWIYAYSYLDDVDNAISTASPLSTPITVSQNNLAVIQGVGTGDAQVGEIVLWRTVQGGSILLYLDTIPNPGAGNSWVYTDTTPDDGLNEFIVAPISQSANPPPDGFIPMAYHLGRIWGFVGATLYYGAGPDLTTYNGNTAFPPGNKFTLPALGVAAWPTSMGLVVFTTSGSWIILGQGTAASPLYIVPYQDDIALSTQDCFTNQGSTSFYMDSTRRVMSMDPGAGELEIGFPLADQFALYDARNTWVAWHKGGSFDTALFVSNGTDGWYRMSAIAAPESGQVWSPKATIQSSGGVKAIASVETSPGIWSLLLGPSVNNNPILMRDQTTNQDDEEPYPAYCDFGSIVIAQPGTQAGIQFVTTETSDVGLRPSVAILMNEVRETATKKFQTLRNRRNDPPNLTASETLPATRFYAMQSAKEILGRHLQVRISWAPENAANELFAYTIYGRLPDKARK